jgi:hypothetical protein
MDELIAQLTQRVGLSPDQARQAAETVLGFVKGRLPAPIAGQLDAALAGTGGSTGGSTGGGLGDVAKGIGGMLGG